MAPAKELKEFFLKFILQCYLIFLHDFENVIGYAVMLLRTFSWKFCFSLLITTPILLMFVLFFIMLDILCAQRKHKEGYRHFIA